MIVLGIDFEATGTDPKTDYVTEIGAVLYDDTDWFPLMTYSQLVKDGASKLSAEAEEVTGITKQMLEENGVMFTKAFKELCVKLSAFPRHEYFIAHNKAYDETLFKKELARCDLLHHTFNEIPWLCTMTELPHPDRLKCRKLSHLALDYGLCVDPSELHRADQDVLLMGRLLKQGFYTVQSFIDYKNTKWVYLQAVIEKPWLDGGAGRDKAKKAGYSWERAANTEAPVFKNKWVKRVAEKDLMKEKAKEDGFPRTILEVTNG